eukprot:gene13510-biopygen8234
MLQRLPITGGSVAGSPLSLSTFRAAPRCSTDRPKAPDRSSEAPPPSLRRGRVSSLLPSDALPARIDQRPCSPSGCEVRAVVCMRGRTTAHGKEAQPSVDRAPLEADDLAELGGSDGGASDADREHVSHPAEPPSR